MCSAGTSVDVIEIDGASNNSVDNIRSLREQVHYLPQSARRKVYIIDEVHMLTTSAFNALLKTLEEPPPHVNFVFATTEPQKLLATILSRVNRLDFRRVSVEQLQAHLASIIEREGLHVEPGGLRLAARAAGGSVRDSLTLLDQIVAFASDPHNVTEEETRKLLGQADRGAVAELVDAILERDPTTMMQRFEALLVAGNDLSVLAIQTLEHLRDLAMVAACKTGDVLADATEVEYQQLQAQAAKTTSHDLGQLFDRFSRVLDRLHTSRTPRLLVEMGLLDLASAPAVVPLGDLVERLNALASGGPATGPGGATGAGVGGGSRGRAAPRSATTRRADADADVSRPSASLPPANPFEPEPRAPSHAAPISPPSHAPAPAPAPVPAPAPAAPPQAAPPTPSPVPAPEPAPFSSDLAKQLFDQAMNAGAIQTTSEPARRPPSSPAASPRPADARPSEPRPTPPSMPSAPPEPIRMGAGPCLPPPPADGVIPWADLEPFAAWETLLLRVREHDDFLAAVLGEVGLVSLAEGVLKVASARHSFAHTELSKHPQMRAQLEQARGETEVARWEAAAQERALAEAVEARERAMRDHFGAPFSLELVEGEPSLPDLPSLVLVAQQRRQAHRAEVEAAARADPRLQALLSNFNGQIKATRPLHEP